jgi:ATP-dependent Lon protease
MNDYAREPGLRSLQKLINQIARKAAARIVKNQVITKIGNGATVTQKTPSTITVKEKDLVQWLGPKRFYNEVAERIISPGIVVGLAWTAMGGEILFIEASETPGSGNLKLTGKMGDVMTESANIAWSYMKKKLSSEMKRSPSYFKEHDFHLHIPAGAIPKDGPSAGITMATALYSLLTGRKSKQKIAMTGELSLIGKVLPIGGVKEKILAARRAGIQTILLPKLNEKDLVDVPSYALKGINIEFVNHLEDVLKIALTH